MKLFFLNLHLHVIHMLLFSPLHTPQLVHKFPKTKPHFLIK